MARTRPELTKNGTKSTAKMYSPRLLKEPTRLGPTSLETPLKTHNANLLNASLPATSRLASKPKVLSAANLQYTSLAAAVPARARTKLASQTTNAYNSPATKPSRPSNVSLAAPRFSARPSALATNTKKLSSSTRLSKAAYPVDNLYLDGDVDMAFADGGGAGDEEASEDEGDGLDNLSNLSGEDGLGEYFDGKTLIAFDEDEEGEDTTKQEELEAKVALVNSLGEPFAKHLATLKEEVIEAIEPSLQRVHLVMTHIANGIESAQFIRGGLMVYDEASEEWEAALHQQADDLLGDAFEESQMRIKGIFEELKVLEERRADWWARVEGLVDEAGKAGETQAAEGSTAVEKTIGVADRKIKAMVSGAGVKKSKGASEMEKLKALMLNL